MNLLSLQNISLDIAGNLILDEVSWQINSRDRIALVGRNGAGKSSLLRVLSGELIADKGNVQCRNGLRIAGMSQQVPAKSQESVYQFLVKDLGELGQHLAALFEAQQGRAGKDDAQACQQLIEAEDGWNMVHQIEVMAKRLAIPLAAKINQLSGGMIRRVLLAAALIAKPDLLLLDEPTNHLDIQSIEWLESYLKSFNGALLLVTHDRTFLSQVCNSIVEIDRGQLHPFDCSYEKYLDRKEAMRCAEQKQQAIFDKKLALEEQWIRTGIKARRTRNEGRVRALKALRQAKQNQRKEQGQMNGVQIAGKQSGKKVIEALHLNYQVDCTTLIRDLTLQINRGDKLGIVGPNGCGKTTLIRLLLGEIQPSSGSVEYGTNLNVAYFDQMRAQLDDQQSLMHNVADGKDFIELNGKRQHVASYLKTFLFSPETFNKPVSVLSGGERNRLLLAKLLVREVNLLVLDEPTNDLDIETLELLESMLLDYQGSLILISHDRAFINQVVTSVLVYEGEGQFYETIGDLEDYQRIRQQRSQGSNAEKSTVETPQKSSENASKPRKLSYNEQRELQALPNTIEALEAKIDAIQQQMLQADYFQKSATELSEDKQQLTQLESELAQCYQRWECLEERK